MPVDWKARLAGQAGSDDGKQQGQYSQVYSYPVWEVGEKPKIWNKEK